MLKDKDLLKFRTPLHITYIKKYILKTTLERTLEILEAYLGEGILEVKNDYYVLKNKND